MSFLLDLLYLSLMMVLAPWIVRRAVSTGRYRRHLAAKLLGRHPKSLRAQRSDTRPVVWFHGVSVGEVVLLSTIIAAFRKRHPDWRVVVSSTTDTGLEEARKRFADDTVIAYPFDFSWAVEAALDAVKPTMVVPAESELWPNFLAAASRRRIPVVVINARISPRTFARLKRFAGLARHLLLRHVSCFAAQSEETADRLRQLGVDEDRIVITGSVKYDGATGDRDTPRTHELRRLLGIVDGPSSPIVWLAGSTHAPEESIVLAAFARLRTRFPQLRLLLVPRHPDRFAEVARLVEQSGLPFVHRSAIVNPLPEMPAVVLLDTVGELGAAWGLADLGFTGGSLDGQRGGQSMIEPAGYAVPTIFGPHIWNFRDAAKRLVEIGGAVMIRSAEELEAAVAGLVEDPSRRHRMGEAARQLVREQQGATARTLDVLDRLA